MIPKAGCCRQTSFWSIIEVSSIDIGSLRHALISVTQTKSPLTLSWTPPQTNDLVSDNQVANWHDGEFVTDMGPGEGSQAGRRGWSAGNLLTTMAQQMSTEKLSASFRQDLRFGPGTLSKSVACLSSGLSASAIRIASKYKGPDIKDPSITRATTDATRNMGSPGVFRPNNPKDVRYGKEIHYLVMEYVEGLDLRRMVEEQGPLDYCRRPISLPGRRGLCTCQPDGFVHRDSIKPASRICWMILCRSF